MLCIARVQQSGPAAMKHLAFTRGSWMTELSHDAGSKNDWETQMWGYDVHTKKLVAYPFTSNGVYTKTVAEFVGNNFVATRDDNGATVTLVPNTPMSSRSIAFEGNSKAPSR